MPVSDRLDMLINATSNALQGVRRSLVTLKQKVWMHLVYTVKVNQSSNWTD